MLKKLTIIVVLFYFSFEAFAQVEVKGYAFLYENKSQGIQDVIISKENGQSVTTDSKGFFNVKFSGEYDRDQGRLKISPPATGQYRDYIVMEVDGYHYINITIGRNEDVKISLCSPTRYNAIINKLAKPYIDKALEDKEKEIYELNRKLKLTSVEYHEQYQVIEDKYRISLNNYMELAEKFARIDPEYADENLQEAYKYFEHGDLENTKKCLMKYDKAKNYIEKGSAVISLWLSITKAEGKIYETKQIYNDILEYTGKLDDRFKLLTEYSEYLFQNRIHDTAFLNDASEYAKEANLLYKLPVSDKIYSCNLLGKIEKEQGITDYFKNYKTAIDIFNNQTNDDSKARKDVAISYTQLANYHKSKKQYQKAENNYKKALDIYILMKKDDLIDAENQINMLFNFAMLYVQQNKNNLVKQCLDRINLLLGMIPKEKQIEFYEKIGDLYLLSDNSQAECYYCNALNYYWERDKENSVLYKKDIINIAEKIVLSNLLSTWCYSYGENSKKKDEEILRYCDIIIGTISKLENKEIFSVNLAMANAFKGFVYKHFKEKEKSKEYFKIANKIAIQAKNKELLKHIKQVKKEVNYEWEVMSYYLIFVLPIYYIYYIHYFFK